MSLGFAIASMKDEPSIAVFADTLLTVRHAEFRSATKSGVKAYDLGERFALVAAGATVPPMTGCEIARRLILTHDRANVPDKRLGLFDAARMVAFFASETRRGGSFEDCEMVIAGFYKSGVPGVAHVEMTPVADVISFYRPLPGGVVAIPVGVERGKQLVCAAILKGLNEGKGIIASAIGMLWHMIESDDPAFSTIGGGLTGASCTAGGAFSWPALRIEERAFLHGIDVTSSYRDTWPRPLDLPFEPSWFEQVVAEMSEEPTRRGAKVVISFTGSAEAARATSPRPLEDLVSADNVFSLVDEKDWFTGP